ncbi:MAG TPA: cellulose binding domain-containing protein, partial [Ktedonobacteraceae bacterium]
MKTISALPPARTLIRACFTCLFVGFAFLLPMVVQPAYAASTPNSAGGLVLEYANYNTSPNSPLVQPGFKIVNQSSASVALSNLTIRYWYTIDSAQTQQFSCDYAQIGCTNLAGSFLSLTPTTSTADSYLQVSFTAGAGNIAAGKDSGPIETRFNKSDWSKYNQTNDFSWNAQATSFQAYSNVDLYQNGQLVWGTEPGAAASVTVNANNALGQLSSIAVGANTAVWDGNLLDAAVPGLLSAGGVKILRYPGGSTSDVYHWQSNTTVSGQSYANPSNTFDAFMGMAQATSAQAMITVNYGSGTPQEAANWVQYANKGGAGYSGPVPSYAGGSSSGHTYGIKYWEIGNEVYGNSTYGGNWEYDTNAPGPQTYGNNVVAYSQAMKAVDPSIKIGAVLTAPGNWPDAQTSATSPQPWNNTVLSLACSSIDYVVVHWYAQGPTGESDSGLLGASQNGESTSVSYTPSIPNMVSTVRNEINQYCGAHASAVQIMVTETNSVSYNPGKQTTGLVNALFLDDNYMTWLENGVTNVDWWTTHNGAVGGTNDSDSLYGTTQYGDYGLLSNGSCVSASVCEPAANTPFPVYYGLQMLTHLGKAGDTMISTSSGNGLISVHAVKQANGHLAIMLINKDPSVTYDVTVSLTGYSTSGITTVYRYGENSTAITASEQPVNGSTLTISV